MSGWRVDLATRRPDYPEAKSNSIIQGHDLSIEAARIADFAFATVLGGVSGLAIKMAGRAAAPIQTLRTVEEVIRDGGKTIGLPGRSPGVRTVGSEKELKALFDELTLPGTTMPSGTYPGKVVKLPDGSIVRMRPGSKSGGPTIDITGANGKPLKVHIDPWP